MTTNLVWTPAPYQEADVKFCVEREYAALFNEMGLGKTSTILEVYRRLKAAGLVNNMLLISKGKICASTWPDEIPKWENFKDLKHVLLHGDHREQRAVRPGVDIYLCPFEALQWLPAIRDTFDMVVVDESDNIKDITAFRTLSAMHMGDKAKYRYILSGTPAGEQPVQNLYSQIKFLDQGLALGSEYPQYFAKYLQKEPWGKKVSPKEGAVEEVARRIGHFCRRTTRAEAGIIVPSITYHDVEITLPPQAREQYDRFEKKTFAEIDGGIIMPANVAVKTGALRQIANGAVYDTDSVPRWVHDAKLDVLGELANRGKPLLVIYEYGHDLDRLRRRFGLHIPYVGGGVGPGQTRTLVKEWNSGRHRMLLLQPKAGADGLNLQGVGADIVFFSLIWSMRDSVQAVARVWRPGQMFPTECFFLVAQDTIDEVVRGRVGIKEARQQELFDLLKQYRSRRGL